MDIETKKVELINWITLLKDQHTLDKISALKDDHAKKPTMEKRNAFGSGKDLISFVSEDFDEPLDVFKEYEG